MKPAAPVKPPAPYQLSIKRYLEIRAVRILSTVLSVSVMLTADIVQVPHLHRDWARPLHICTGTWLAPATSAPGLGSNTSHICTGSGPTPAYIRIRTACSIRPSAKRRHSSPFACTLQKLSCIVRLAVVAVAALCSLPGSARRVRQQATRCSAWPGSSSRPKS